LEVNQLIDFQLFFIEIKVDNSNRR
jgi:hypothetical protein